MFNVEFVGEKLGQELVAEYKTSQLFVLPSASEGQPLSLLEAQVCGLPIVATKVGGIPEIVHDGKEGILVQFGDYKQLARAIIKALKYRKKYSSNALKNSKSFLNWEQISNMTYSAYQDLLK